MGDAQDLRDDVEQRRSDRTASDGTIVLNEEEGYVGDDLRMQGVDLPANETVNVIWESSEGRWGVLQGNEVIGPQYQPREERIASPTTDGSGSFTEDWTVIEDYGGEHVIRVDSTDGETLARATYEVRPWFDVDRTTAPLGETFTVKGYGLGPNMLQNNYQIAWDNGTVGFITGVVNRGTATAEIRATPPVGDHVLQVWRNYRGVPFLQNNTQSPFGPVAGGRKYAWEVEVTDPEQEFPAAWIDDMMREAPLPVHLPDPEEESDAELDVSPHSGQPGDEVVVTGRKFPANTVVDLVWHTHEGHRVKSEPIRAEPIPDALPAVETDDEGQFQERVEVPRDKGATRPITAEVDGTSVAVAGFMMQPKIVDVSPTEGPVGTDIEIEIAGVGWPTYGNAYQFVYDNKPLGYICGLEAKVNKTVLKATGEPGTHFIDVYPSLFEVDQDEPDFELNPHLSYLDNHPVRPLPALHFTFDVTE